MPTEAELRLHRCCFTGHRPEKIGIPDETVIALLDKAISEAIQFGYRTFISGMARGVDIWAAVNATLIFDHSDTEKVYH